MASTHNLDPDHQQEQRRDRESQRPKKRKPRKTSTSFMIRRPCSLGVIHRRLPVQRNNKPRDSQIGHGHMRRSLQSEPKWHVALL